MPYSLKLHREIEGQLERLPRKDRERVADAMRSLCENPRPHNCLRLLDNLYRVPVGRYRIIYAIFDDKLVVFVCKMGKRAEATYRDLQALLARAQRAVNDE